MRDAGVTRAADAIERYFSAFGAGPLCDARGGTRLEGLAATVRDLRSSRAELVATREHASARASDPDETVAMECHIEQALTAARCRLARCISKPLVHESRVEGCDRAVPWLRAPGGRN